MSEGQDTAAAPWPHGRPGYAGPAVAGPALSAGLPTLSPTPDGPSGLAASPAGLQPPAPGGIGWAGVTAPDQERSRRAQETAPEPMETGTGRVHTAAAGEPRAEDVLAGAGPGGEATAGQTPLGEDQEGDLAGRQARAWEAEDGEASPGEAPEGGAPGAPRAGQTACAEPTGTSAGDRRPSGAPSEDPEDAPFARVDARKLEAALLSLRHLMVATRLLFDAPGVSEARAERVKLLSQIDDYLLPRLRQSGAPILVALVGSTGAGKSTLLNSLVGRQVSATGIRRPTTNSPVLACHPDDMRWFAENVFLPTLPRVRQQGLAMPGRDGLLVLAASEGMPRGVAVLDTPDIDSVVQAHHDFAHQFLDASDLWLFVTTARRYADAAVWEMLKDARDRGASLALALSRVPPTAGPELAAHFEAMLEANGLGQVRRFIIPETVISDAQLPAAVAAPVRDWLADTARREERRVAVLTQTMSGVLDTFRDRVPALAGQVADQLAVREQLREVVESVFIASQADFHAAAKDGSLLRGPVLARWQDFAGTGDLLKTLQVRRGRAKPKRQDAPDRGTALSNALRASLVAAVVAIADRAAAAVIDRWQQHPAGAGLLAGLGQAGGPDGPAGSGGNAEADFVAAALADLGLTTAASDGNRDLEPAALGKATPGVTAAAERAVDAWQEHILHLVREQKVTKRSIARVVSFDDTLLALVLTVAALGYATAGLGGEDAAAPQRLLESLFGTGLLRDMGARVRSDLEERVGGLLSTEAHRFFEVIDMAGVPEDNAGADLLEAANVLEDAR